MKINTLILCVFASLMATAQSLPIDFESAVTTSDFVDFDGGTATVITNPQNNADNPSSKVAQIVRDGGTIWSGSKILLSSNLDFSTNGTISMKVFTTAPIGTIVKFKLEGGTITERDAPTTVSGQWETLTWDFTGTPSDNNYVVFMFDFGNVGNGTASSTFLFDDVQQISLGRQIDWPVTFEEEGINYTTRDFGGNESSLVTDPTDAQNHVVKVIKKADAASWAGTTVGTLAGFKTALPLTMEKPKMTVRVWSATAGTPIRLKVEDSNDDTHTCETQTNTTKNGEWETLEFDFSNEAAGTATLQLGLDNGWVYNMASLFFNYNIEGATAGEKTYYFDDVRMGDAKLSVKPNTKSTFGIYPNPSSDKWTITSADAAISAIEVLDYQGKTIEYFQINSTNITLDGSTYSPGIYFVKIFAEGSFSTQHLIKK
jgi:hypothetical protein